MSRSTTEIASLQVSASSDAKGQSLANVIVLPALRLRAREIELQAGVIFSVVGMVVAPIGAMIGHRIAPAVLLSAFAVMMGYVGVRMWRQRKDAPPGLDLALPRAKENSPRVATPSSQFSAPLPDSFRTLWRRGRVHRAVATSLMVIFLISVSGVVANVVQGQQFPVRVTALFLGGCFAGMLAGSALSSQLSSSALEKTFAVAMWLVAVFMLVKNLSTFVPR